MFILGMEDFFILEFGRRIKEKRLDRRMTLHALACKSNVSKGLISQIENGRTIPSLPVMLKIIQSLEIKVSDFFKGMSLLEPTILVVRNTDYLPFVKEKAKGFSYRRIMMRNQPASTMDFALLDLDVDCCREEVTTDAYEFVYVIKGETEYHVNSQILTLREGDSIFFDGRLPHVPKNNSVSTCTLLVLYFFDQNSLNLNL